MTPQDLPLTPPPAPAPSHRDRLSLLPGLASGSAANRLDRARTQLQGSRELIRGWHQEGMAGLSVCRLLTQTADTLVKGLFGELWREQGSPRGVTLVALGSYGRRELSPHSDLDLLLLTQGRSTTERVQALARAFPTLLWDLKIAVGWAVRTPGECAQAAEEDHTVRTALLDCRYLAGDEDIYQQLAQGSLRELLSHRADAFIGQKAEELRARRVKFGDSVFLLEPNLKQGEGGLRDLEAALWVAQARYRTRGLTGLLQATVLPGSEVAIVRNARDFLLRSRHQLHYLRGRKEDRLTFDLQEAVAGFFHYATTPESLAVEKYMRDYYLAAQAIRRAADALIARCEEGNSRRGPFRPEKRLGAFKVFRGKLAVEGDGELFVRDPASVVTLFRLADEEGLPLYSYARDQVTHARERLREARAEPAVVEELKRFLVGTNSRGRAIWEMHELGVLGDLIPEFGRVTARHQHDLYHVYTVDIHSIFAVSRLYALRAGDRVEEEPGLSREMRDLEDPLPLYLGMLLHDAGKGMGGNHSERGRELMAQLGERLRLTPRQREIAEFLVLQHLLMSHTAQRRDLSDPDLIAEFSRTAQDPEKLACLYLLTWADISSVAPSMWTAWKAQLHRELFEKARACLLKQAPAASAGAGARSEFMRRWTHAFGEQQATALGQNLSDRYFVTADPAQATLHARLLRRAHRTALATTLAHRPELGLSELHVAAADRPGFLALVAGVLAAHRIDIASARIESTTDGYALDVFEVRVPHAPRLERERWRRARADLYRVMLGEVSAAELLARRSTAAHLTRPAPRVATKVSVDNRASQRFTVVDVRAEDRMGLLYAIASVLAEEGAEIALAKVATEANRAIDSFYVSRRGQKILEASEIAALSQRIEAGIAAATEGLNPR